MKPPLHNADSATWIKKLLPTSSANAKPLCLVRHFHFQESFPLSPIPYIKQLPNFLNDPKISSLELLPHD